MSSARGFCSASSSGQSMEPLDHSVEFKSGAVYTGSVKKGSRTRCGQGTFSWPSGLHYNGEFWNNKRHGTGLQLWPDGSKYEGMFRDDMRHGQGRHSWKNGEVYEGGYVCDKKHGHGRYSWPSGAYFCGYFESDLREGAGVYVSPEGEKFEGVYCHDVRYGEGVMTYPGGRQDVGMWKGTKLIRLRFTVAEAIFDPSALSNPLGPLDSSLGTTDHKSRGNFGPKGPLEIASEELIQAAALGHEAKMDTILKAGVVHVDVVDKLGQSALLAAAIHSHPNIIHLLLDNGADVNLLDDYGISALNACHHVLYASMPQVHSLLSRLPSLKPSPVISPCSTFTEHTLHTCDLFSTPGLGDIPLPSSPLTVTKGPQKQKIQHPLTSSLLSPQRERQAHTHMHKARLLNEGKEMLKSKSLGALVVSNGVSARDQPNICLQNESVGTELAHAPMQQVKSYPLLASLTRGSDEKKVRFTPLHIHPRPARGKVLNGDANNTQNAITQHESDKNVGNDLIPSITTTSTTFPSPVIASALPSSTPQHEVGQPGSQFSSSLGFGSITNADQLPPTASVAAGEEDILGVSALSGDYYSASVDPWEGEGEGHVSVLSQQSNLLPEQFESESITQLDESPLARSTPAINSSTNSFISRLQYHHNHMASPLTKLKKAPISSLIHDSPEQCDRRSSLLSSPYYGSIVSAAQSTSISCIGSELDPVTSPSCTPSPSPSGGELVPLCTPRDSISVLLQRGADPNLCLVPLPPLFYAIRAGDLEAVEMLLKGGANTEICLPLEVGGQYPLHTAVTCLHSNSVSIVKALLEHRTNPNSEEGVPVKANGLSIQREEKEKEERVKLRDDPTKVSFCVGDEADVQQGEAFLNTAAEEVVALGDIHCESTAVPVEAVLAGDNPGGPGYTPLHLLCSMDTSAMGTAATAQLLVATLLLDMVKLLLAEGAEVNSIARGHSPLSLAIVNGHNQIVDVLLESGADPNQPLGRGVANALCVLSTHQALRKRDLPTSLALVSKLLKFGADVLQSVKITDHGDPGTVADFAHAAFKLDKRLSCLKYHSLTKSERSRYRAAKKLQQHFTSIFKCIALQTIAAKEESWQNMHKKEAHSCPSIDLPCLVRQKLCRTTSAYDSSKPLDIRGFHKRNKCRPILSAGGRPRNGPGMLSISLPEHTLRAALENIAKAHSSKEDGDTDDEEEPCLGSTRQSNKGLKNDHSQSSGGGHNGMRLDEMFEKAKLLLPAVRCECTCIGEQVSVDQVEADRVIYIAEKKEWTIFSFCYECGRTLGVHLVKCPGCRAVSYCSRTCRSDNWKKGHQKECTGAQVKPKDGSTSPAKGKRVNFHREKVTKRSSSNVM